MAKINIYLDRRKLKKSSKCPLKLSVNHAAKTRYISLNIDIAPQHWDENKHKVKSSYPPYKSLNLYLEQIKLRAQLALLESKAKDVDSLFSDIASALGSIEEAEDVEEEEVPIDTIVSVAHQVADLKTPSTKLTYLRTIKHLEGFAPADGFEAITPAWLSRFDSYMSKSAPSPNARAIHMRNLRAIVNFAIDEGITKNYPFRRYKIKTMQTEKRNLPVEDLRQLFTMEIEPWIRPYRDFFALSFLLIGINPKDLMELTAMRGDRIVYNRSKTKKLYSVKVEPEAMEIINRYRGERHLINTLDTRTDYLQYIRYCNHGLQSIKDKNGRAIWPEISTYWARHSWATIAASLDIPKETIAAALGHGGSSVTDIYIDFDSKIVDIL